MRFKNLDRYRVGGTGSRRKLAIPPPRTPDGRVYRFSPNADAQPRHFVLGDFDKCFVPTPDLEARMKLPPRSSQTVCPYSGTVADDSDFTHPDDVKAAEKVVEHAVVADAEAELGRILNGFNRSLTGNRLFKIEAKVEKRHRPKPRFRRRDLLRELVCDHCSRDYGVYAIALFCPDCGAPNLRLHFAREAELVGAQVDLAEGKGDGQEELAYRLLGNAHEDVLTAFEATLKTVYLYGMGQRGPGDPPFKPVKNDFQNVDFATQRFADLGLDPFAHLTTADVHTIKLNIQKRHVIGHNLSVVDDKFARQAQNAKVGETVHLVGEDIRAFARIGQQVVDRLDAYLLAGAAMGTAPPSCSPPTTRTPASAPAPADPLDALDVDLSPLARRVGLWIAKNDSEGRRVPVQDEALRSAFPAVAEGDLSEAVAELQADGLVTCSHSISDVLPRSRPTEDLYFTFDPLAHGHDPTVDAGQLAGLILAGEASVDVASLHATTGWPLRRFNPALALVAAQVDERRVSQSYDAQYPTRWLSIVAEDRVALKRFARRVEQ